MQLILVYLLLFVVGSLRTIKLSKYANESNSEQFVVPHRISSHERL